MKEDELNELKLDIYKLYGKHRGKKIMNIYRKVLDLIAFFFQLKRSLKEIRKIGGKHTL